MSTQQTLGPDQQSKPRISAFFRLVIAVVVFAILTAIAYDIFRGIQSRVNAATALKHQSQARAIPTVNVTHAKSGGNVEDVVLPGNAQAYVATPIYARTNGYLKSWNFDIGAH